MNRKSRLMGIILILLGVILTIFFLKDFFVKEQSEQVETYTISDVMENQEILETEDSTEIETDQDDLVLEQEEESIFPVTGIPDEIYEFLEIEKRELEEQLMEWTTGNGYSAAIGASFYEEMTVDFGENKYSFMIQLNMSKDDNREEEAIIFLDYYKKNGKYVFHQ